MSEQSRRDHEEWLNEEHMRMAEEEADRYEQQRESVSDSRIKDYVSRPVQIKAVQWDGSEQAFNDIMELGGSSIVAIRAEDGPLIRIHTNNGPADLYRDHWLIKGEFDCYPCDPQTFQKRWERKVQADLHL